MKHVKRIFNIQNMIKKKSIFLFGPRGTGKTTLIRDQLVEKSLIINLLKGDNYLRLSGLPSDLEKIIDEQPNVSLIVIDEIQRIPELLNEVHNLIEERKLRFLLTGSSARKLKQNNVNLLGGRAWEAHLFPLCWKEIKDFHLARYLRFGGLPSVYLGINPEEDLHAYVNTYLKEEIQSEALVRKLSAFSRFLKAAALSNGKLLNFSDISSDTGVSISTVREYYHLLEDTLIGFYLPPWIESKKRKAIQTAKFYFFDTGVTHTLAGTKTVEPNSDLYGSSLEQFIGMELNAYLGYKRIFDPLCFWRSTHQHEVDFLIGDHTAIEVKATKRVTNKHLRGLRALKEEKIFKNLILVSQQTIDMREDGIRLLHWESFLKSLWSDNLF